MTHRAISLSVQHEQREAYRAAADATGYPNPHAWALDAIRRALGDAEANWGYRCPCVPTVWLDSRTRANSVAFAISLKLETIERIDASIMCGQSRKSWLILVLDAAAGVSELDGQLVRAAHGDFYAEFG